MESSDTMNTGIFWDDFVHVVLYIFKQWNVTTFENLRRTIDMLIPQTHTVGCCTYSIIDTTTRMWAAGESEHFDFLGFSPHRHRWKRGCFFVCVAIYLMDHLWSEKVCWKRKLRQEQKAWFDYGKYFTHRHSIISRVVWPVGLTWWTWWKLHSFQPRLQPTKLLKRQAKWPSERDLWEICHPAEATFFLASEKWKSFLSSHGWWMVQLLEIILANWPRGRRRGWRRPYLNFGGDSI